MPRDVGFGEIKGEFMKWFLVLPLLFLTSNSWARITDGQVKLELNGKNLVGKIASGFHINIEAPAKLVAGNLKQAPTKIELTEIVFDTAKVDGPFTVSFYACDDKNTVCEEHTYFYKVQGGKLIAGNGTKASAAVDTHAKPATLAINEHGFVVDDLDGALARAKNEKKLVFVDFGAPWCPACVRLETEVFGTKAFKHATKNVIKVSLNPDIEKSFPITEKYKIVAYPTLLILDSDGKELYRSVDFKPADELSREFAAEFKAKSGAVDALAKKAEAGDKAAQHKMALRAYKAYQFEEALKWYEKLGEKNAHYADVEMSVWQSKDLKDDKVRADYEAVLKKWIAMDPNAYTAVNARNAWSEVYTEKPFPADLTEELNKNVLLLKALADDPKATHTFFVKWGISTVAPFEQEEILANWISTTKALKQEPKDLQIRLAGLLQKKDLSIARPGEILENLNYFRTANMVTEEGEWLLKLEAAYPESYVYPMRLGNYYKRQKDFAKALPAMQRAVDLGPDLRFYNLKALAEIQKELKKYTDAKKSIELALAMPEAKHERFKDAISALEELKKTL